jgi:hypothetical protein
MAFFIEIAGLPAMILSGWVKTKPALPSFLFYSFPQLEINFSCFIHKLEKPSYDGFSLWELLDSNQ